MPDRPSLNDLVDRCIAIHEAAMLCEDPGVRVLAEILLYQLGREIAAREGPRVGLDDA